MDTDLCDLGVYIAKNGDLASSARVAQLVERVTSKSKGKFPNGQSHHEVVSSSLAAGIFFSSVFLFYELYPECSPGVTLGVH
jgi:hypothetical protein